MAYGPAGDFNFLEVGRAAFDLSDRGVGGRPQPGPVDAFLYTDRGIYRPGENVYLTALMRDDKAAATAGLPLTLRLVRPDGVEVERRQLTGGKLGGYAETIRMARDARIGTWRVELKLDPKAPAIGSAEFRVEDFVPPQLKVALSAGDGPVRPGEPFPVAVARQLLLRRARGRTGGAGAGDDRASTATRTRTSRAFASGWLDEQFTGENRDLEAPATDADGKSTVELTLADLPDVTQAARRDRFGQRVRAERPRRRRKPDPADPAAAAGDRAALADRRRSGAGRAAGQRRDHRARPRRQAHRRQRACAGNCCARPGNTAGIRSTAAGGTSSQVRDVPVAAGALDIAADNSAKLSRPLPTGRYRWEVTDAVSGAQTSLRFHVGWFVEAALPDVPDKLSAVLDKPTYQPGETAKLFVKAPFAGEAELAIASDRILAMRSVSLPAEGATIEIPVEAGWGSGVYALVSAFRPQPSSREAAGHAAPRGPGRAVGVAWLGIDASPRTLSVALAAPDVVRPRGPADVAVKVAGLAAGEEAYVTLAAVDEAVLKLTEFASPAPEKYYYGKRQLGVELRDLYGRLIDPRAGAVGVLRSGGDQFAKRSVAGLPDKSSRVVALFSGIVRLDKDGAATRAFRHSRLPGPAAADGGGVFRPQGRLRRRRDDGARPGRDDGVAAALYRARRHRPDRARHQQPRRRRRRLPAEVAASEPAPAAFAAPVERTMPLDKGKGFTGSFPLSARRSAMSRCASN